ncbi:MAG: hypothetical protein Q7V63_00290 [Gammaproteobacteria bacterium]|nr:hypothetical protein [Gammaproteobacteria bacterium]
MNGLVLNSEACTAGAGKVEEVVAVEKLTNLPPHNLALIASYLYTPPNRMVPHSARNLCALASVNKELNAFFKGSEVGIMGKDVIDPGTKKQTKVVSTGIEIPKAGVVFYKAAQDGMDLFRKEMSMIAIASSVTARIYNNNRDLSSSLL